MTAKEKAKEIAMKFDKYGQTDNAVKCTLICVDEMLKQPQTSDKQLNFLIEVKQEINKL